jgi:hypothetical protein
MSNASADGSGTAVTPAPPRVATVAGRLLPAGAGSSVAAALAKELMPAESTVLLTALASFEADDCSHVVRLRLEAEAVSELDVGLTSWARSAGAPPESEFSDTTLPPSLTVRLPRDDRALALVNTSVPPLTVVPAP